MPSIAAVHTMTPVQKNKNSSVSESVSKSLKQEAFILNRMNITLNNRDTKQIEPVLTNAADRAPEILKEDHPRSLGDSLKNDALDNTFPPRKQYQGEFQLVDVRIFAYSAIYENASSSVRTLVLVPQPFKSVSFFCILKRSRSHLGHKVKGHFQHIPPSRWGTYKNRCGFVHCPVPPDTYPAFIAVLTTGMSSSNNVLPVNYPGTPYNNLTRCYPAVHGNFTDVNSLVTALETSRYFGTDKFIFYNYSIPEQINKVLLQYEREGIVEMRNWRLPLPPEQIHYWGQMASIHDCVFSQLGVAKYVLLADIDEIIVPKRNVSLVDLADRVLNTKDPRSQNVYGALMFQNTFFSLYENETKYMFTEKTIAKQFKMKAFLHTNRSRTNGPQFRSKLLVKPEAVDLIHIHIMEKFLPGWVMYVVSPEVALMHHYREEYDRQSLGPWSQDFTFIQYSSSLIPNIQKRLLHLQSKLGIQI
ncbi:uncharacterized protein LOC124265922 [Haliotis rubra]|uniref:uncharacterized protein LOC124265922 n=1 Tax=Haliotis rubra TaxID=36100 RepID=UPI001EE5F269|nr:uncharacterized protein LOC124265922 [Haliotis rubra]